MATETTKLTYIEGAAASTPAANRTVVYCKADGLMYSKDDAGVETLMSAAGPGCYEHILTTPVTIVNANTFYNALTLTPLAGTYLVIMTMDLSQVSASGSNMTARLVYNGATIDAHNSFVGAGGGNACTITCQAVVTVSGSLAVTGDGADNRGSSDGVILDTANVNGTADKCTRMIAIRIGAL